MKMLTPCSVILFLLTSCCSNNQYKNLHGAFKEAYLKSLINKNSDEYVKLVYPSANKYTIKQMHEIAKAHHALKRDMAGFGKHKITEAKFEYVKKIYTEPLDNDEVRRVYDYYRLDLNKLDYYSSRIIFYSDDDMIMTWFLYFVKISGEYYILIPPDDIRIIKKIFNI